MSCGGAAVRAAASTPRPQTRRGAAFVLAPRLSLRLRLTGHVPPVDLRPAVPLSAPMTLTVRRPRDLTENQLTTLPPAGLGGLMHLKLRGNPALSQPFSKDSFPKLR